MTVSVSDVGGKPAESRVAKDNAGTRLAVPARANRLGRFLNLVVQFEHLRVP